MRGIATLAAMAFAAPSAQAEPPCTLVTQLASDEMFARYPAAEHKGPWRAPDVRHGRAHLYRTLLRQEGTQRPDFAGQYRIVRIGCGAGTLCTAFIDRATGRVHFPSEVGSLYGVLVRFAGAGADDFDRIIHRRNSRLLIALGIRNDDELTSGATLYEWRNDRLNLIRFIPLKALCTEKEDE